MHYNTCPTRWLHKILGYNYIIEYEKGVVNIITDSLSHVVEFQLLSISMPHADWWADLKKKVNQDSFYSNLTTNSNDPTLLYHDGVWFKNGKILLQPTSPLITKVFKECYSSTIDGHFGFHKMLSLIKNSFI